MELIVARRNARRGRDTELIVAGRSSRRGATWN